jgi:hypothetical protein
MAPFIDEVRIYNSALTTAEVSALTGVPEPATVSLVLAGALALGMLRRRGGAY